MYKLVITLNRKEDLSSDDFREYYREEHLPLVEEMPKLKKFTVSFPLNEEDSEYDSIAELYYEEAEHIEESLESKAGQEAVDDVANFGDPDSGFNMAVKEEVQIDET
jgi:uncharacterized protein (TIGR02118 family)